MLSMFKGFTIEQPLPNLSFLCKPENHINFRSLFFPVYSANKVGNDIQHDKIKQIYFSILF